MNQVIDIEYQQTDVKSMLESVAGIIKSSSCKVTNKHAFPIDKDTGEKLKSIYDYMETSNIIYEELLMCDKCRNKELSRSSFDVKRQFIVDKYYTVDTAYPLFRSLGCLRDKFAGSGGEKQVNQHEISMYKEVFKLLYFLNGSITKYNEEKVKSLFSQFEYHLLLPELLTGLVNGLITLEEEELLCELLSRDKETALFLDKLKELSNLNAAVEISPILPDFAPIIVWNPTQISLLKEYVCMGFSMLLSQIIKKMKSITSRINVRSISDFRFICELETMYEKCLFKVSFNKTFTEPVTFVFESECSTDIVKKYFNIGGCINE